MSVRPWWDRERHADRRALLLARNRAKSAIRTWFETGDFIEVDPCAMQVSPGNEAHLHAFGLEAIEDDGSRRQLYLHTSPEFAMKKLLAAGEERIFTFAHVWRNRERGRRHSPEFEMLEWYRVGESYEVLMQDCAALMGLAARAAGAQAFHYNGISCDPFAVPERLSVPEAFLRYGQIDLLATMDAEGRPEAELLRPMIEAQGLRTAEDDSWSDMLSRALTALVEPHLGHGRPTVLDLYPAHEAALARRAPHDRRLAERFELYACGVELANGFGELTDPVEQRARFIAEMDEKERVYGERYPLDEDFLAALAHMPDASGIALGFDRLVMLATGAPRIEDVIWAPAG